MQRLAGEAEILARGDLSGRVTIRGPEVVVATARSVQKLAHLAAEGGGRGGEVQVVQETVTVLPTAEIHAALAPTRGFERPAELEIESTHKACPQSGNDYHDVVNTPDGKVGLFVADIPVRGIQGAMFMSQVRSLFRAAARKHASPADVLKDVNAGFAIDLPRGVYVTAMYAVLDPESGVCRFASAGHLPLVFWKVAKKGSARVTTQGIALGHDAGPVFDKSIEEKAIQLDRGDRVVIFSDGAISARNASGATYGEERFYYVVNREAPKNSAAFVNFVANDVDLFHEGADQLDDFTILTARKVR
jgi:sigma-B regulation protein RsbU (phosphoserine phosphatase)